MINKISTWKLMEMILTKDIGGNILIKIMQNNIF